MSTATANDIRTDYLNLLITQLRNQNPLEPMDNNQMASQRAQLSQLEQLENMNSLFQKVLVSQQLLQGTELIGQAVRFRPEGQDRSLVGTVQGVRLEKGKVRLEVDGHLIDLEEVEAVGSATGQAGRSGLPPEFSQAAGLIGKEVTFVPPEAAPAGQEDPTAGPGEITGRVDGIEVVDGQIRLSVGEHRPRLGDIRSVRD